MSDPRFIEGGYAANLCHLIEEMGEAIAAAGKTARFGPDSVNPLLPVEQQETNWAWLSREMEDVIGAWNRLRESRTPATGQERGER